MYVCPYLMYICTYVCKSWYVCMRRHVWMLCCVCVYVRYVCMCVWMLCMYVCYGMGCDVSM